MSNSQPATIPATNLAKTVAKTSYSLLEYLHGMQEVSGSSPLGSIYKLLKLRKYSNILEIIKNILIFIICNRNLIDHKKIFKGISSFTYFLCVNLR